MTASPPPWHAWPPGTRVVVRRRLEAGGEHLYTDVLGEVLEVDDDGLVVATRHGDVRVAADQIVLGKVVPPAPARRPRRVAPD